MSEHIIKKIIEEVVKKKLKSNIIDKNNDLINLEYQKKKFNIENNGLVIKNKYDIKDVLKQIFNGLKFMKSRNIIHLDLKPENILVNTDGARTTFKITDFGIAIGNSSVSITNFQFGTLLYLPDDKDLVYTTYYRDLYAFYCIIYYLYNKKTFNSFISKFNRMQEIPGYLEELSNVFLDIQKTVKREVFENINYGYKNTIIQTSIDYNDAYESINNQINLLPETENKIQFINIS